MPAVQFLMIAIIDSGLWLIGQQKLTIISKAMKCVPRQPIYLTKFRKRQRENQLLPAPAADSIEYDLQIFQDSLNIPDQSKLSEKPNNAMINSVGSTMLVPEWYPNCNTLNATGPFRKGSLQDNGLLASVHKTKASFKPNTARNRAKEDKENRPVIEVRLQPKLNDNNQKNHTVLDQSVQPAVTYPTNQGAPHHIHCPAPPSLMEKAYQLKISELSQQNQQSQLIISDLTHRLQLHQSEKDKLTDRICKVEQQLIELSAETQLIGHDWNHEDYGMQTETEVANYAIQTVQTDRPIEEVRVSEDATEDWFVKARQFKMELQRERMVNFNRESEHRVLLENSQIEWRAKLERAQRQLSQLQTKYDSKCQQVRDKDSLINKYLHKH